MEGLGRFPKAPRDGASPAVVIRLHTEKRKAAVEGMAAYRHDKVSEWRV